MATTIQISKTLHRELVNRRLYDNETYEDIIWDMIEDSAELSEQIKRDIKEAEEDIKKGRVRSFKEIKKELQL
ncbi:MAG: hypothetical protein J4473_03175 [Candidatus Aenigmarchaeota archaeon]|nr:hypothetical protein [Candidatus Aenigmarchaeota archaeon]